MSADGTYQITPAGQLAARGVDLTVTEAMIVNAFVNAEKTIARQRAIEAAAVWLERIGSPEHARTLRTCALEAR